MLFFAQQRFIHQDSASSCSHLGIFARGKIAILILIPILSFSFLVGCGVPSQNDALLVSAAANLQPALTPLEPELEKTLGMEIIFNYGSSGRLAQQIEQGAPVDLFLSANQHYVKELILIGALTSDSITPFARGRLVIWTWDDYLPLDSLQDLAHPAIQRIAIPNPDHAPYGAAAREALQAAGLWDALQPKLVFSENVIQSSQFALQGDVDVAFVAASLVISESGRWIDVPEGFYAPLEQTAAVTARSTHLDEARAAIHFLLQPSVQAIFRQFGYLPAPEASS